MRVRACVRASIRACLPLCIAFYEAWRLPSQCVPTRPLGLLQNLGPLSKCWWPLQLVPPVAALYRLHIGIADGMSIVAGADVPVLRMTASARAFQRCVAHAPVHVCTHVFLPLSPLREVGAALEIAGGRCSRCFDTRSETSCRQLRTHAVADVDSDTAGAEPGVVFLQHAGACRRRTPRTPRRSEGGLEARLTRERSGAALRRDLAPRRSPSACAKSR